MAKQVLNIGVVANDGTGDNLRDAMDKSNDNFTELYDNKIEFVIAPSTATSPGVAGTLAYDSGYLYVCIATNTWLRTMIEAW